MTLTETLNDTFIDKLEHRICGVYFGPVDSGATVRIDCAPPVAGRYLVIKKPTPVLTLCEVEVYGTLGTSS